MDNRDTIKQRIIDRAVTLFAKTNPSQGGLFTTAHYGQAMKAEFSTPGPTLDSETCTRHLLQMDDLVEKAGSHLWQRKSQPSEMRSIDDVAVALYGSTMDTNDKIKSIEDQVEKGIIEILSDRNAAPIKGGFFNTTQWWTIDLVAKALHHIEKENGLKDGLLENLVGIVLYTMAVDGRALSHPDMLVDGSSATVFTLSTKSMDIDESPDDAGFGNKFL